MVIHMKVYAVFYQDELRGVYSSLEKARIFTRKHHPQSIWTVSIELNREYEFNDDSPTEYIEDEDNDVRWRYFVCAE